MAQADERIDEAQAEVYEAQGEVCAQAFAPRVPRDPPPAGVDYDWRREAPSETTARRTLRAQVAKLERELAAAFVTAFGHVELDVAVPAVARGGPRLLTLGELEQLRDTLADRVGAAQRRLGERADEQERNRQLLERVLLEPGRYKYVRIRAADLGEGGCGVWHVRPRFGLIGMLAGWWQVKLSSGCPLAPGPRRAGAAPSAVTLW